jgi:hypothetical protein
MNLGAFVDIAIDLRIIAKSRQQRILHRGGW